MKRSHVLIALAALALLGAGGYLVAWWLNKPSVEQGRITPEAPRVRATAANGMRATHIPPILPAMIRAGERPVTNTRPAARATSSCLRA